MHKLTFHCKTITPMFLAGADGRTPELRAPSIKGTMRFWWRAMNGHFSTKNLHKRESEIFGGTEKGQGRSKFSVNVTGDFYPSQEEFPSQTYWVKGHKLNILEYLAYGTYEYDKYRHGNVFTREYIPSGTSFIITLKYRDDNIAADIFNSFAYCLQLFGGLGSRCRNGFGSFFIEKCYQDDEEVTNIYHSPNPIFKTMMKNFKIGNLPQFVAFSKYAKMYKTKESYDSWHEALGIIGKIYRAARLSLESLHCYDKRQYIAAPIIVKKAQKSELDRRAKSYFLHISKEKEGFWGNILFLPSTYCDGIEGDPSKRKQYNKKFLNVCNDFNKYLTKKMDVI